MNTFLAVSHTARSNAQTGIQTVARGLVAAGGFLPVAWFERRARFHLLKAEWARNMGTAPTPAQFDLRALPAWIRAGGQAHRVPLHRLPVFREPHTRWFLMPELMDAGVMEEMFAWTRCHALRVAVVFHDAIPWLRPDLTERDSPRHQRYMAMLANADLVLPVSRFSENCLREFWNECGLAAPLCITCELPAEVASRPRGRASAPDPDRPPRILCVSTLEARKNHRTLIEAFTLANPRAELHLAGDRFEAAPEIADFVTEAARRDTRIRWHGSVSSGELHQLYEACDFTVYPSFLEGFGLPVMESLWFGRPCICANFGVMAENAAGGGCLTVDVNDTAQLADAITRLVNDLPLREKLGQEAALRPLRTWQDYAGQIQETLVCDRMSSGEK